MSKDADIDDLLEQIEKSGPPPSEAIKKKVEEQKKAAEKKASKGSVDVPPSDFRSRMNVEIQKIEESDGFTAEEAAKAELMAPKIDAEDLSEELINQVGSALGRFNEISNKILKDYQIDRLQAQAALDHYFEMIENGGKVPRVYIEKLADVLRAKNEISMTPIRLLDSITKFMSASKNNNILIQNNNNNGPDLSNLANLLDSAEKYEDEID